MLDHRRRVIRRRLCGVLCAALLGALLCFYGEEIWRSSGREPSYSHAAEKSTGPNDAHDKKGTVGDWLTHDAAGFFTLWLVIVGFGQAGLFLWQLIVISKGLVDTKDAANAARDSAKAAESALVHQKETTEKELRAYIVLEIESRRWPVEGTQTHWDNMLKVTNSGKTWARNVRIKSRIIRDRTPEPDPFNFFDWNVSPDDGPFVMGADSLRKFQFEMGGAISLEDTIKVWKGTLTIDYVSWIKYQDAFGKERQTQLFQRMNAAEDRSISFFIYPTHNCADDDCPK